MEERVSIQVEFMPAAKGSTRGTLLVKSGSQVLHVDKFDLAKEKSRLTFLEKLFDQYPAFYNEHRQEELKQQLLEVVSIQLHCIESDVTDPDQARREPLCLSRLAVDDTDPKLIELAQEFLSRPDLVPRIIQHINELGVAREKDLILSLYLVGTSRLLRKPLAAVVLGISSSGKSYVINVVIAVFPPEAVLQAHKLTPSALEYMPAGSLKHRFVVAGERSRRQDDEQSEATRALREMISDGRLSKILPIKRKSGEWESVHIEQEGPISYCESTTLGVKNLFEEDRTRLTILSADEGRDQTEAIVDYLATVAESPPNDEETESIKSLHHTAQRLLRPYEVIIPFAKALKRCLPFDRVEVRRCFGRLLGFIKASAILHQFQREKRDERTLVASIDDYAIVRKYLAEPLARSLGCALTPGAKKLWEFAKELPDFTIADMASRTFLSPSTISGRVRELVQAGWVIQLEKGRGQIAAVYKCNEDPPSTPGLALPEPSEIIEKTVACRGESAVDKA